MRRTTLRAALAFAVSGALLAVVLSQLDAAEAIHRFRTARPGWIALGALASLAVLLLRGTRFTVLAQNARWPLTTAATSIQNFLNRVTPFRLGELSLPWILHRHGDEDAARAVVSVLFVRLIDMALVLAAVVLSVVLRRETEGAPPLLPSLLALGFLGLLLATFRPTLRAAFRGAAAASRLLRLDRFPAVGRVLGRLHAAVADGDSLGRGRLAAVAACSLGIFAGQTLLFAALLEAFSVRVGLVDLVQGGAVAQAGGAIPVAAVGSFGTQEAAWVAGFVWVGVSLQDALVTAVACQLFTLAFAAAFALPAWIWISRSAHRPAVRGL